MLMEENLHYIDDLFRKELGDAEDRPSAQVWDTIARALDEKEKPVVVAKPRMRWYFAAAAAVVLAGIAAMVWFWSGQDDNLSGTVEAQGLASGAVPSTMAGEDRSPSVGNKPSGAVSEKQPTPVGEQAEDHPSLSLHVSPSARDAAGPATLPNAGRSRIPAQEKQLALPPSGKPNPQAPAITASTYLAEAWEVDPARAATAELAQLTTAGRQADASRLNPLAPSGESVMSTTAPVNLRNVAMTQQPAQQAPPASPVSQRLSLPRIAIMPMATVNFTSNKLKENPAFGPVPGGSPRLREFEETEQNNVTVSPGLLAELRVAKRLTLVTGVSGFQNSVDIAPKKVGIFRDPSGLEFYQVDCSLGSFFLDTKSSTATPIPPDSIKIAGSKVTLRYLTIPLALKLYGGTARFSYFATAGLEYTVLLSKDMKASLPQVLPQRPGQVVGPARSEGVTQNFTKGMVGAGVDLRLSKRFALTLMPQYRFALNSSSQGAPVSSYPNSFSVTTGLKISL